MDDLPFEFLQNVCRISNSAYAFCHLQGDYSHIGHRALANQLSMTVKFRCLKDPDRVQYSVLLEGYLKSQAVKAECPRSAVEKLLENSWSLGKKSVFTRLTVEVYSKEPEKMETCSWDDHLLSAVLASFKHFPQVDFKNFTCNGTKIHKKLVDLKVVCQGRLEMEGSKSLEFLQFQLGSGQIHDFAICHKFVSQCDQNFRAILRALFSSKVVTRLQIPHIEELNKWMPIIMEEWATHGGYDFELPQKTILVGFPFHIDRYTLRKDTKCTIKKLSSVEGLEDMLMATHPWNHTRSICWTYGTGRTSELVFC
ncbi:hypothetical protein L596_026740 [Steinernema carpocapsae]|uniref:Uncharacterized protein n=1 Tax=Steinernema carpocapsae TaxID=34508 RepID=A0A4U5M285_STECR|nr:hypothetical protein L596_026740 [Steinernema carpocapsae]